MKIDPWKSVSIRVNTWLELFRKVTTELANTHTLMGAKQKHQNHKKATTFIQDERLLYVLTWPASWLNERALPIAPKRYEKLILQRLDAIAQHGHPQCYLPYFPRYLLKSLQDWFAWHGEELYDELKHIRNSLPNLLALIQQLPNQNSPDIVTPLAQAHAILAIHYRRKNQPQPKQLTLF